MNSLRPKKALGQHFLKDIDIASRIADTISYNSVDNVIEIGSGMGILTSFLLKKHTSIIAVELDKELVNYLNIKWKDTPSLNIISIDFLKLNISDLQLTEHTALIGNFPYYISTQILFRVLENKQVFSQFAGMFQKEVAQRICSKEGSRVYGILSVLTQAFYDVTYSFTVYREAFHPQPKVESGVIYMTRKENYDLPCSEVFFFKLVKMAFNQRRKKLRNSLKQLMLKEEITKLPVFDKRPEQLSVQIFIDLSVLIEKNL